MEIKGHFSNLQDIAMFVEVARTRSFSKAAENLGLSAATLSRHISALEKTTNIRLFNRTTRRVELTSAGERYFERCNKLIEDAEQLKDALLLEGNSPSGLLRTTMPVDLGIIVLCPILAQYARHYPSVRFEIDLSPQHRDLLGDKYDISFRIGPVHQENLISRRIGWIEQRLFAAPGYLKRHGVPSLPSQLVDHDCIFVGPGKTSTTWHFDRSRSQPTAVKVSGRFAVNNHGLMRTLAELEMGIATLSPTLSRESIHMGRLVPVLADWELPSLPVHAVTTSRQYTASVKALVDFITERFRVT